MQNNIVKSSEEIALIQKGADIIDDVYDYILDIIKEDMSEIEISNLIEKKVLELGGDGVSFETIVAFGENGCEPHHIPNDMKLKKGMFVTLDMGSMVCGYASDFTRTFAFGEVSDEHKLIYKLTYESQLLGMQFAKAGERCIDVDHLCRRHIALGGYGEYFPHGTGHGVGREVHEKPYMNSRSDETLQKNMVVTIEPGIYIPVKMGVRIEDMLVVGTTNRMSRHSTELITINI